MEYSGAGGKLIHEKNQKQKVSWHCPFKEAFDLGDKVFLCGGVRNNILSSECSVLGKNEFMCFSFNLILQIKSRK